MLTRILKKIGVLSLTFGIYSPFLSAQLIWEMSPYDVRELINNKIASIQAEVPEVYSIQDQIIQSEGRITPIRIYGPSDKALLPVILFIHGGAWVAGNLDTHDNLARYLCSKTEAIVVSVGYLNSPEGKFTFRAML